MYFLQCVDWGEETRAVGRGSNSRRRAGRLTCGEDPATRLRARGPSPSNETSPSQPRSQSSTFLRQVSALINFWRTAACARNAGAPVVQYETMLCERRTQSSEYK